MRQRAAFPKQVTAGTTAHFRQSFDIRHSCFAYFQNNRHQIFKGFSLRLPSAITNIAVLLTT